MSVKRRDLVQYLEAHGFYLLREGANHSIYTNAAKSIPVKRHRTLDRITANDGQLMEMHPRQVDIPMAKALGEASQGKDSQLETAVNELLKEIGNRK